MTSTTSSHAARRSGGRAPAANVPRRVSGPLRERSKVAPITPGSKALAGLRSLPDHALLDRLVRGRFWIPLLGVMLAGIVAMQVEVLKLNASIGRSLQRGAALQSQNELLRASVSSLTDGQRIESLAAGMGMVMPAPDAVGFLSAQNGAGAARAAANIHPPDASSFLSLLPSNGGGATGQPTPGSGGSSPPAPTATQPGTPTAAGGGTVAPAPTATAPGGE